MKFGIGAVIAAWLFGLIVGAAWLSACNVGVFDDRGGFLGATYKGVLYECIPLQPKGGRQ